MHCEEAQYLFDSYLDGDLAASIATELDAHKVQCPDCRRTLALMEVAGHIIAEDRVAGQLDESFTDRLLACVEARRPGRRRLRLVAYVGGPMAAAAILALAFLGVFGRRTEVAGVKVTAENPMTVISQLGDDQASSSNSKASDESTHQIDPYERWAEDMRKSVEEKRKNGESLESAIHLTILQFLDVMEQASKPNGGMDHYPGAKPSSPLDRDNPLPPMGGLPGSW